MPQPDLYLSHALDDVRLAAAIVDFLEEALPEVDGCIACTAVPGYEVEGGSTRDNALVIGLWSEAARVQILPDLTRALDRGRSALLLRESTAADEPVVAPQGVTQLAADRAGLSALLEDVAYAVGTLPRMGEACSEALTELMLTVHRERELRARADETPLQAGPPLGEEPTHDAPADRPLSSQPPDPHSAPVQVLTPARAIACVEVAVLLAESLFHDTPLDPADIAAGGRVCGLYEALGGISRPYPAAHEVEAWQDLFDTVLDALPIERQGLYAWFEAAFQLALACNLVVGVGESADMAAIAEARADAWRAFSAAAEQLRLPVETLQAISAGLATLMQQAGAAQVAGPAECIEYLQDAARMYDAQRASARRGRQAMQA